MDMSYLCENLTKTIGILLNFTCLEPILNTYPPCSKADTSEFCDQINPSEKKPMSQSSSGLKENAEII
jgi:hypothetical protein